MMDWLKDRWDDVVGWFEDIDWLDVGKWGLMVAAGLCSLGSGLFDSKKKDNEFRERMNTAIDNKVDALVNEMYNEKD